MQSSYSPEIDPARAMMLRRCQVIHEAVHNTLRAAAEYTVNPVDEAEVLPQQEVVNNPLFDGTEETPSEAPHDNTTAQAREFVARALQQDEAA